MPLLASVALLLVVIGPLPQVRAVLEASGSDALLGMWLSSPPPAKNCGAWQKGVGLAGRDMMFQKTGSAGECCVLCGNTVGASKCTGWTWNLGNHLCYLKNNITGNVSQPSVSGGIGPGPPLPIPPAPTPSPEFCGVDPPDAVGSLRQCPWYNASSSFAERRDALVAVLTPSEKLAILAGGGVERLHVVSDGFNEALHGVAWTGRATVFPCPLSLAATFNTSLVHAVGVVVAKEALAKHWGRGHSNALSFFAPNINIIRDIRWGRAQETYGEAPTLTSEMGVAYVRGMQELGNATGPLAVRNVAKHFAAYNLESNFAGRKTPAEIAKGNGQFRLQYDAPVSKADLMQTFLPAFEAVVKSANIRGVMCAYNSVNGQPLCANKLLQDELRDRMGFTGIVITDCGAIGMMTGNHHWKHSDGTPYTPVEATAAALTAGTDLNCGGSYASELPQAYKQNLVTLAQLDKAVGRVLYGFLELGLFQDTAAASADTRRKFPMTIVDSEPHRALAKQAALEGVVLLKNRKGVLPLGGTGMAAEALGRTQERRMGANATPLKLAVVGPNANRTLTLTSNYAGCTNSAGGPIIPSCTFVNPLQGIRAAAKASQKFDDNVAYAQGVDIDTLDTSGIPAAVAAAKQADVTIVITGLITCQEVGPMCQEAEARDRSTPVNAEGLDDPFSTADIGRDYGVGLPGRQLELLQTLANTTDTTLVLVVMSGSGVAVPWAVASPRVGAIVQHFYAGVLGGEALADVLFGLAAPAGKLPVMIVTGEEQLPTDYLNQSMRAGLGRTSAFFKGKPLFPFGFGMGYSTFSYSALTVSHSSLSAGTNDIEKVLTVSVSITNHGEYSGNSDEVVTVFATPRLTLPPTVSMSVPQQVLLAFTKVTTAAGSTTRISVKVPAHRLRLVGPDDEFALLGGEYVLHVGGRGPGTGVGHDERLATPLATVLRIETSVYI